MLVQLRVRLLVADVRGRKAGRHGRRLGVGQGRHGHWLAEITDTLGGLDVSKAAT